MQPLLWPNIAPRFTYKHRNRIEIMFGRIKDWRRVATRYDRCPKVFRSAIALAAIVIYWLCVLSLGMLCLDLDEYIQFRICRKVMLQTLRIMSAFECVQTI